MSMPAEVYVKAAIWCVDIEGIEYPFPFDKFIVKKRGMNYGELFIKPRVGQIRRNVPSVEGDDGFGTCDLVDKCGACGAILRIDPWSGKLPNFCHNCGARLVES